MPPSLSQAELDQLLAVRQQIAGDAPDLSVVESTLTGPEARVHAYDFRTPNALNQEALRALRRVHDAFARGLGAALSDRLLVSTSLTMRELEQARYAEFITSSAAPAALWTLRASDQDAAFVLEMEPRLAVSLIERMLGGTGALPDVARALTNVEQRVARRLLALVNEELRKAWAQITGLRFQVGNYAASAELVQVALGSEPVLLVPIEIMVQSASAPLTLCYPLSFLEPVLARGLQTPWQLSPPTPPPSEQATAFAQHVEKVEVELRAELGRAHLPLLDLMQLEVGDVLLLDRNAETPVTVLVPGCAPAEAIAGTAGRRRALQMLSAMHPLNPTASSQPS